MTYDIEIKLSSNYCFYASKPRIMPFDVIHKCITDTLEPNLKLNFVFRKDTEITTDSDTKNGTFKIAYNVVEKTDEDKNFKEGDTVRYLLKNKKPSKNKYTIVRIYGTSYYLKNINSGDDLPQVFKIDDLVEATPENINIE